MSLTAHNEVLGAASFLHVPHSNQPLHQHRHASKRREKGWPGKYASTPPPHI